MSWKHRPSPDGRAINNNRDYEDRITSIALPSGTTDTFSYNGVGSRVGKTDSTGTYSYCRDGVDVTDPVLNDSAAEYTPGISESRSGTSAFYHADRLGSTTKISNSSDTVTDTRQYDAFGMLLSSTGSNPTPFGFVQQEGYQTDPDSGLMLLGHRFYDPSTGRFLTRDGAMDGRNWYDYCSNNPYRYVDPSGENWRVLAALYASLAGWNQGPYASFYPSGFDPWPSQPVISKAPVEPPEPFEFEPNFGKLETVDQPPIIEEPPLGGAAGGGVGAGGGIGWVGPGGGPQGGGGQGSTGGGGGIIRVLRGILGLGVDGGFPPIIILPPKAVRQQLGLEPLGPA